MLTVHASFLHTPHTHTQTQTLATCHKGRKEAFSYPPLEMKEGEGGGG